jgi:hypothetical protein
MKFIEGSESDRVQRNGSRISVLGFGQMDLPTLEVDLAPLQSVLLAHPHPGMDGQKEVRQELLEPAPDGSMKADLFLVGQEADASPTLCLSANARRRIPLDLLVVDSNPENQ